MAKRFQPVNPKSQFSKKIKLDVSFANTSSKRKEPPVVHRKSVEKTSTDFWGDDDDEVILLASQAFENIEDCSQQMIVQQNAMIDISYSRFNTNVPSSTQIRNPQEENENFQDLFDKDTDDGFDNIEAYFRNEHKHRQSEEKETEETIPSTSENFKRPQSTVQGKISTRISASAKISTQESDLLSQNKKNLAKDAQVNYLKNCLDSIKKDNDKLLKDVADYDNKFQTKEGEVSMLRQELLHLKQVNENLRLERIQENQLAKKEWLDKIQELENIIKSQKSELEFKNVEIINIKTKKLNQSQRFGGENFPLADKKTIRQSDIHYLFQLHLNLERISTTCEDDDLNVPPDIFEQSLVPVNNYNFGESLLRRELECLQCIIGKIQLIPREDDREHEQLCKTICQSILIIMEQLNKYSKQLEFTKYRDTNASIEYAFLCQENQQFENSIIGKSTESKRNIFQEQPLFINEKACLLRRIFAALSIICLRLKPCSEYFFDNSIIVNGKILIKSFIDSVDLIGYSQELYSHFGLVEAFGRLLNSFVKSCGEKSDEYYDRDLMMFIKALIFCRPNGRPLAEISACLVHITSKWKSLRLIDVLCSSSSQNSILVNEYYKIFQFSSNACPLQVYGVLLEVAIPQYKDLTNFQVDSLTRICYSHMIFLRNCIKRKTVWVWTSTRNSNSCDCYIKLATSFIVLLYQVLKQWVQNPRSIDIKIVSTISKVGTLLLCDFFHINYRREILQNGGSAIKNRLQMTHYWLREYKNLFHFKTVHCQALDSIRLSHIIADPIRNGDDNVIESATEGDQVWENSFEILCAKR